MSFLTVNVQIWRAETKVVCKTVKPSAWRSQDAQLSTTTAVPHIAYWEAVICLLFLQAQMYIHHMTATGVLPQQVAKILQELLKLCIYICALLQFQCIFFSCPQQLNRWPCHSLSHSLTKDFTNWHYRVTLETCDLWDIWSEWWGNMTWPTFWQFFLKIWKLSGHVSSSLWSNVSKVTSL